MRPQARGKRWAGVVSALMVYLVMTHTQMVAGMQMAALSEAYPTTQADGEEAISFETTDTARRQVLAADLPLLQAFQSLANAVTVQSLGDGASLRTLKSALDEIKQAYETMSSLRGPAVRVKAAERIIKVEKLLFNTVATELGNLGLIAGLLGLAAFICLTVTGALFTAGSAVLLATQIQGLSAAVQARSEALGARVDTADPPQDPLWFETSDFLNMTTDLGNQTSDIVSATIGSGSPVDALKVSLEIIKLLGFMLNPKALDARDTAQANLQKAKNVTSNLFHGL